MPQLNDLSRSLVALVFETTLIDLRLLLLPENQATLSRERPRVRIPHRQDPI